MKRDLDAIEFQIQRVIYDLPDVEPLLLNWGRWASQKPEGDPRIAAPSFWDMFDNRKDRDPGWGDPHAAPEAIPDIVHEGDAERVNAVIHDLQNFPTLWRNIMKVCYVWYSPKWKWPGQCRLRDEQFIEQFRLSRGYVWERVK